MQRANAHCVSTVNLKSLNSEAELDSTISRLLSMKQSMVDTLQSTGQDWSPKKQPKPSATSVEELAIVTQQLEQLWRDLMENVGMQRSELFELKSYSRVNEEYLLYSYKTLVSLTQAFAQFSNLLHDNSYPLEVYKSFRKMYELLSTLSTAMHKYRSLNGDFNEAKEGYITQQLELFQTVHTDNNTASKLSTVATEDSTRKDLKPEQSTAVRKDQQPSEPDEMGQNYPEEELRAEIARLQDLLQQNNEEFTVQIEKYNRILYEQQDELKACQHKFMQMQARLEQLESNNLRLREQRTRDDLLIEYILKVFRNMSRKLRVYQKEAGYLSPSRSRLEARNPSNRSRLLPQQASRVAYPRLRGEFTHTYLS